MADEQPPQDQRQDSLRIARANLARPGPFGWKLRRFVANEFTKLFHLQSCCGHAGEPGC